jgi:hypothetical protein
MADPSKLLSGLPSRKALRASRVNGVNGGVGVLDWRREFAGGEGVEAAETRVEFRGGQAAVAEEPAEKIGGGTFAFERIAFEATGNQVAVGIASALGAGRDVIEALGARVGAAQTIKTASAFAEVNGLTQGAGLQEVELLKVNSGLPGGTERGALLLPSLFSPTHCCCWLWKTAISRTARCLVRAGSGLDFDAPTRASLHPRRSPSYAPTCGPRLCIYKIKVALLLALTR